MLNERIFNPIRVFFVILIFGLIVYSNSFHIPFQFDDVDYILNNTAIHKLNNFKQIWDLPGCEGRFLVLYSFALNWFLAQENSFGYHVVNFVIHIINAFLVYVFALLILLCDKTFKAYSALSKRMISFFAALLFLTHPLQMNSVTYLTQRFASAATLFYLLSIILYVKGRLEGKHAYFLLACLSAIGGLFSKETIYTLPLMIILFEIYFLSGSIQWKAIINKGNLKYLIFIFLFLTALPWFFSFNVSSIIFNCTTPSHSHDGDIVNFSNYTMTQFEVIWRYIRLIFLPINQNLDYDFPSAKSLFDFKTLNCFIGLLALFYLAVRLSAKEKIISFGILWFFITLSIESSIIPIRHVIFEHRTYLPLVGFCLIIAMLLSRLFKNYKKFIIATLIIICTLSYLTFIRNSVWKNEVTLWQDVVKKSPNKARGYINLSKAYIEVEDNYEKALVCLNKAYELTPDNPIIYNGRAAVYIHQNKLDLALKDLDKAVALQPDYVDAYNNRGVVYKNLKEYQKSLTDFTTAIKHNKYFAGAYNNIANVLAETGDLDKALIFANDAIAINPKFAEAYNNRGFVYYRRENYDEALKDYDKAIKLKSNYVEALSNRAVIYNIKGEYKKALLDLNKAINIMPTFAKAFNNRGIAYNGLKQYDFAIKDYTKAMELQPDYFIAYNNRGNTFRNAGDYDSAIRDYTQALLIKEEGIAYINRSKSFYAKQDYKKALTDALKAKSLGLEVDDYINKVKILINKN